MESVGIIILLLFFISTSLLSFIWFVYYRFRLNIKHPNKIFFSIASIQILENLFSILIIFLVGSVPTFRNFEGSIWIVVIRYIIRFLRILDYHYTFMLNAEIFFKIRSKIALKYNSRVFCSVIYSWIASVIFTIFSRASSDIFLPYYSAARLIYQVYMLTMIVFLLIMTGYYYSKYSSLIKSKKMYSLLLITVFDIFSIFLLILTGVLGEDNSIINEGILNYFVYILQAIEGSIEFIISISSARFRRLIKQILNKNEKAEDGNPLSLNNQLIDDPDSFQFCSSSSGLFSDIFDHMTKNVMLI